MRIPRRGRTNGAGRWLLLASAYLAVLSVAVWLVIGRPQEAREEEAVPALAPAGGTRAGSAGKAGRWEGDGAEWSRGVATVFLRLALPIVDLYGQGGDGLDWRRLFPLRDAGARQAARLLRLSLPVLALEPEDKIRRPGELFHPVPAADLGGRPQELALPVAPSGPPLVIVYSTHSHESYLPDLRFRGAAPDARPYSDDMSLTVVRVAAELARTLNREGVPAVHVSNVFDREGLTGAYMKSEEGVTSAMRRYPTAKVLVDVHRDSSGRGFTTTVAGGETYARLLFVVGMGSSRLPNPRWRENQAFAREVARRADTLVTPDTVTLAGRAVTYPPLVRQLSDGDGDPWTFGRNGRFNQHLSPRAILVELGGPENTLAEALRSARVVGRALADVIRR